MLPNQDSLATVGTTSDLASSQITHQNAQASGSSPQNPMGETNIHLGIPFEAHPQSPPQLEGVILSSALQPIPARLVRQICAGEFVEMRDLLSDNIAVGNQLEAIQGPLINSVTTAALRPRIREVPSLTSWVFCYLAYVAVRTSDQTTWDLITYCRLIVREALRHGGQGWQEYDRSFRAQAATNLSQRAAGGSFCTLCRGVDHSSSQCSLSPF